MRLSQILTKLRQEISDPSGSTNPDWSDAELSGIVSDQVLRMFRRQTAIDEHYHNHRYPLLAANATKRAGSTWAYVLPEWGAKIVEVRLAQQSVDEFEGKILRARDKFGGVGWRYSGRRELEIVGYASEQDLTVACAKQPARLTLGTLPEQTGMAANQVRLDLDTSAAALLHPHEVVTDSYANAVLEVTGVDSVGHEVGGQVRNVIASAHRQVFNAELYTVLTLREDWLVPPVEDDTYELHPEIDDMHLRLLVLLCARACWTRKGNGDEVRASQMELHEEWSEFQRHVEPRGLQEPKIIKEQLYPDFPNVSHRTEDDSAWLWT